ncbi:hypothetical protein KIPB_010411, partial [Kipferlia bialata]|eukprot:g10411.t1
MVTVDTCFEHYASAGFDFFVKGFQAVGLALSVASGMYIFRNYKGRFYDGSVLSERLSAVVLAVSSLISVVGMYSIFSTIGTYLINDMSVRHYSIALVTCLLICLTNMIFLMRGYHFIFHLTSKHTRQKTPHLYVMAVVYVLLAALESGLQIYTSFFAVRSTVRSTSILDKWQILVLNRVWTVCCEVYFMSK